MVAVASTIREIIELRKFAMQVEEVLYISYDDKKYTGSYVTEEERARHQLPNNNKRSNEDL
jgi:hypothetical protein